jgi:hypothetical protein
VSGTAILQALHDSEINFTLESFFDGDITWRLGDSTNGYTAQGTENTIEDAVTAIAAAAREKFPKSQFAIKGTE